MGERLGVEWTKRGAQFSVFSESAEALELCLFEADDHRHEIARVPMSGGARGIWRTQVEGLRAGALYGFRAHGPYAPAEGQRFNPHKVLLDPYARAIAGEVRWCPQVYGYLGSDLSRMDESDNAHAIPKSVLVGEAFDWGDAAPPATPWEETVVYELHVGGFTMRHPEVPESLRGTYLGLAHPAVIEYLKSLGVTAVELLPVHHRVSEHRLDKLGLSNYWGYATIGFFAPDARFSSSGDRGGQVAEFKEMVKAFHRAGLEVILDVVYNHTAEGGAVGPHLSFRGLDNRAYYRVDPQNANRYLDTTGCGNALNVDHPMTLRLVLDSLRYWAQECRVDGFRFDLAPTLARTENGFDPEAPFFRAIAEDPVLSTRKLIAEPWDLGEGGYRLGEFPSGWAEWNGRFRDTARRFWRADEGQAAEFASRLAGSSDVFEASGRTPGASINFVACHDGFTLEDLTTYEHKRNEANGEENRDGTNENLASNCGVEGPTDDAEILRRRTRRKKNLLASLLLSQGVPMLQAGDEFGRTQNGNNNAYCHDDETSWVDWTLVERNADLLAFVRDVLAWMRTQPGFRRTRFFSGAQPGDGRAPEIVWLHHMGREMTTEDWGAHHVKCFGFRLRTPASGHAQQDVVMALMNAHHEAIPFAFLGRDHGRSWEVVADTADGEARSARDSYLLAGESMALLAARAETSPGPWEGNAP